VHLRLERLPVSPSIHGVRRDVAVVDEDVGGGPVLRLAREPVAALEQQDALARCRERWTRVPPPAPLPMTMTS
jgi:hypothetical protein